MASTIIPGSDDSRPNDHYALVARAARVYGEILRELSRDIEADEPPRTLWNALGCEDFADYQMKAELKRMLMPDVVRDAEIDARVREGMAQAHKQKMIQAYGSKWEAAQPRSGAWGKRVDDLEASEEWRLALAQAKWEAREDERRARAERHGLQADD